MPTGAAQPLGCVRKISQTFISPDDGQGFAADVGSWQRRCWLTTIQDVSRQAVRGQIEFLAAWNCENRGWAFVFVHFQLKDAAAKRTIRALTPCTSLFAGAIQRHNLRVAMVCIMLPLYPWASRRKVAPATPRTPIFAKTKVIFSSES